MIGNAPGQTFGHLQLGHGGPVFRAVAVDELHGVCVTAEGAGGRRNIVGENPVTALGLAFGGGLLRHVLGLGGEPHHQGRAQIARL